MSNSTAVPSIDSAVQQQVDQEMSLEWRSAPWRVVIPATLAAVSLVLFFVPMPIVIYEMVGAAGGDFAFYLSQFGAFATLVVAFRTAQVRPLWRLEEALVTAATLWMLCGVAFAVLLGTIGDW